MCTKDAYNKIIITPYRFIPWPLWPMFSHWRTDILARGHFNLLHRVLLLCGYGHIHVPVMPTSNWSLLISVQNCPWLNTSKQCIMYLHALFGLPLTCLRCASVTFQVTVQRRSDTRKWIVVWKTRLEKTCSVLGKANYFILFSFQTWVEMIHYRYHGDSWYSKTPCDEGTPVTRGHLWRGDTCRDV